MYICDVGTCKSVHVYKHVHIHIGIRLNVRTLMHSSIVAYLEVRRAYNWLHKCSYKSLRRPLSKVSQVIICLEVE